MVNNCIFHRSLSILHKTTMKHLKLKFEKRTFKLLVCFQKMVEWNDLSKRTVTRQNPFIHISQPTSPNNNCISFFHCYKILEISSIGCLCLLERFSMCHLNVEVYIMVLV